MSTFNEVRRVIISDMAREGEEGITASVDLAIGIAISHYESMPWWFLETQTTIETANGTEYYDLPSDFGATEFSLRVNDNSRYPLVKRTFKQIEEWSSGVTTYGSPSDYAVYQDQIRLYPIPDRTYSATLSYASRLGPPSFAAENFWTNEGEALIRARVEWQMHSLRYHDAEAATIAKQVEQDAFRGLQRINMTRLMTGQTRKRNV